MSDNFPELDNEAYEGVLGDLVSIIEPQTEAHPAALLSHFIAIMGTWLAPKAYVRAEADKHYANLFILNIGDTAKGRKGTSLGYGKNLLSIVDPDWTNATVKSGLSSGEGLIKQINESEEERDKSRQSLLVVESEFAIVLKVLKREGNIISVTLRSAWDSSPLSTMTKHDPLKASNPHVSIIGHITSEELKRSLNEIEVHNGLMNRFLLFCVKRSKMLPRGGRIDHQKFRKVADNISAIKNDVSSIREVTFAAEAEPLWDEIYYELGTEIPGLAGTFLSRAEPQILRISLIYALLDRSDKIEIRHLNAGYAVWKYCRDSTFYLLGTKTGCKNADKIYHALKESGDGLNRSQIRELFNRNLRSANITQALTYLERANLAFMKKRLPGSKEEIWIANQ